MPKALSEAEIQLTINAFVAAARRAARIGFDFIELHGAHGYLIHEFLSPLANQRTDQWGGSLENRMRFFLAILREVRAALPADFIVGARMSGTDWMENGFTIDEAVKVATALKKQGLAYLCVSSGGMHPNAKVPTGPSYQVPLAARIRQETGLITRTVGLIDDPKVADNIVATGKADLVALARAMLADPRWPWRAAKTFGAPVSIVPQYRRSEPLLK